MALSDELERDLVDCFGEKFLESLARVPYVAYGAAHQLCAERFRDPEAENVRPWLRRGMVETLIQDSSQPYENIETKVVRADKSAWNHTEVRSGRIILTASTVQSPCGPVEFSEYRAGFALAAAQLPGIEDERSADAPTYVLLLHSPQSQLPMDPKDRGVLPGSVYLAWPAADLNGYVHKINLVERHFPIIRRNHLPKEWTDEAAVSYLRNSRAIAA
jgi:hypothetical protein